MTSTPTSKHRIWTPGRVVALLVIAAVIAGLGYARLAHPAGWAAVRWGAHAGHLDLKRCMYETGRGDAPPDCGPLVVPENRGDPASRLIALPVTRVRSRSPHPARPPFRLEGGRGKLKMTFPYASCYTAHHHL